MGNYNPYSSNLIFGQCLVEQLNKIKNDKSLIERFQWIKEFIDIPFEHSPECSLSKKPFTGTQRNVSLASVGVIMDKDENVLITRRNKRLKGFPSCWVFPGGHKEKNEDFSDAMLREVYEETAIQITKKDNSFYYNEHKVEVVPIFIYESQYPNCDNLKYQTFIVFYKVKISLNFSQISVKVQLSEVDAYAWVALKDMYMMSFEKDVDIKVNGFQYNETTKEMDVHLFTQDRFTSIYNNWEGIVKGKNNEHVPHGHVTAIKTLYKQK